MEALVYIFGIMLVIAAAFCLVWKVVDTVRGWNRTRKRDAENAEYVVTEYVKNGKIVSVKREKREEQRQ